MSLSHQLGACGPASSRSVLMLISLRAGGGPLSGQRCRGRDRGSACGAETLILKGGLSVLLVPNSDNRAVAQAKKCFRTSGIQFVAQVPGQAIGLFRSARLAYRDKLAAPRMPVGHEAILLPAAEVLTNRAAVVM